MSDAPNAPKVRKSRHCRNCGQLFTPSSYGERFCGENRECDKAEAEAEREDFERREQAAREDEYGRY